jgi:single-strand DNA-binding protein
MASVNKVMLLGNCGRDPEVRSFPDGGQVANVTIATSRRWKDKTSGEKMEETEWHRLVFHGRLAEVVGEYVSKGNPIFVEGRLRTRKYEKDGQTHYATEIVCDSLQLLGSKDDGGERGRQQERAAGPSSAAAQRNAYGDAKSGRAPAPKPAAQRTGFDDMDDDIQFASSCESFDAAGPLRKRMRRYGGDL